MRHRKSGAKLGRTTSHRKAMMRNMATSLFDQERIVTTEAKAKALRPLVEKLITLAKRGDLHARRQVLAVLTKKSTTHKLFGEIKDRFMDRPGGCTSLVKVGPRRGDCAEMAVLQLIKPEDDSKDKKKGRRKRGPRKKGEAAKAEAPKKEKASAEPAPAKEDEKAAAPAEPEPQAPVEAEAAPVEAPVEETAVEEAPAEEAPAEEKTEDKPE